jgi:mRNA interferase MazF
MQVVAPATAAERRGFVLLSGDSAMVLGDSAMVPGDSTMVPGEAPQSPADGIEVTVGPIPGWAYDGVVRVALPRDDRTFCTWLATLTPDSLVERFGELAPARLDQLGHALKLARIE